MSQLSTTTLPTGFRTETSPLRVQISNHPWYHHTTSLCASDRERSWSKICRRSAMDVAERFILLPLSVFYLCFACRLLCFYLVLSKKCEIDCCVKRSRSYVEKMEFVVLVFLSEEKEDIERWGREEWKWKKIDSLLFSFAYSSIVLFFIFIFNYNRQSGNMWLVRTN